jgi:hypothetical protein
LDDRIEAGEAIGLDDRIEAGEAIGGEEWPAVAREFAATNVVQKSSGHLL